MLSHRDTIFNMDAVKARRKGLVQELRKLARSRDVQAVRDDSGWAKVKAMHEDTQTHRHTDTQTHRHTDTQTHRHTDTQTHRHTDTQTHRHTDTKAHRHKGTQTHTPYTHTPDTCPAAPSPL